MRSHLLVIGVAAAMFAGCAAEPESPTSTPAPEPSAATVGDDVYVVHPHFADADPPSLERVVFQ